MKTIIIHARNPVTLKKFKLVFNPLGLSVHSLKIADIISYYLRLTFSAARVLFQATDHDVIQRVGGGVELSSYGKPERLVLNTAVVLPKTFP